MTITAEVRGCTVTLHQPPLASGTQGNVTVAFRFDTAWDGYARTAVFRHGVGLGKERLEVFGDQQIALLDDLVERLADVAVGVEDLRRVAVRGKAVLDCRRRGVVPLSRRDG